MSSHDLSLANADDLPEIDGQPLEEEGPPALTAEANAVAPSAGAIDLRGSLGGDLGFDLGGDDPIPNPPASGAMAGSGFVVAAPAALPINGAGASALPGTAALAPLPALPSFTSPPAGPAPMAELTELEAAPVTSPRVIEEPAADLSALAAEAPKSSQENLGDLLGEMDFDLPPPPAAGATAAAPVKPVSAMVAPALAMSSFASTGSPSPSASTPSTAKPGSPSFGAFKAAGNPFSKTVPAPVLTAPAPPIAAAPLPPAPVLPAAAHVTPVAPQAVAAPLATLGLDLGAAIAEAVTAPAHTASDPTRAALIAALRSPVAATALPQGAELVVWNLARVLVAKGLVSVDDLV